jgi:hypothetical protein
LCSGRKSFNLLGERLQARGDVDAIDVDVVALNEDIAEIDADAQTDGRLSCVIERGSGTLHRKRIVHGIDYATELDNGAVAVQLHDAASIELARLLRKGSHRLGRGSLFAELRDEQRCSKRGAMPRLRSGRLHGDRTKKVALADVYAVVTQNRISGRDMEMEVRQQKMVEASPFM